MSIFKSLKQTLLNLTSTLRSWYGFIKVKLSDKPILKKILYTLLLLAIFRIGATIVMPGVSVNKNFISNDDSFLGILNMMGGGALSNFSIVALGISPYITSSIIMTLLQSEAFPPIYRMARSGPAGKRKINYITIFLTLVFAWLQGVTIILSLGQNITFNPALGNSLFWTWFGMPLLLMAGSLFVLFLANQITNKGIGNGTSLIIFSGIVVQLPTQFIDAYRSFIDSSGASALFIGLMKFLLYLIIFFGLLWIIAFFYKAERHIPIQQTGSGLTHDVKQMSRLPIKLNPAGVMPIIFALTITVLPLTLIQFLPNQSLFKAWMEDNWSLTKPIGLLIFILLTFAFSIVMGLVTFNPDQVASNFKKNGTFIPGIKPGTETERYLTRIVMRLSFFSAFYLSAVTVLEYVQQIVGLSATSAFGGTSVIILVSVAVETIEQLRARDQTVKISKAKQKTARALHDDKGEATSGGLLW